MAFLATSHTIHLICLTIFLSTIFCVQTNQRHETIVSTPATLPIHFSLDYPLETECKQKLVSNQKELLIISTLDGKLSALDVKSGQQIWSKALSSEPLLSSTISNFEINRKGRVVRVVPSLDGNLYLYNGKTIDGIPLNADILLKSSFKLGDDLVITGGQESHISGIDLSTGKVYYECGLQGCPSAQLNENETFDDLFLLKRNTQTVRAIDPRNGRQKWYFSVTEPQISETSFPKCRETSDQKNDEIDSEKSRESDFNIIVPNGFISVKTYSDSNDNNESFQWSYRFGSPIVHVWHYRSGRIDSIDLFDKQKLFGLRDIDLNLKGIEPSVYIGLYRHQWYVQSSDAIKAKLSDKNKNNNLLTSETNKQIDSKSNVLEIEWKPNAIVFDDKTDVKSEKSLGLVSSPQFTLSISSEDEENVGYYIFDAIEDNETKCFGNSKEEQNDWDFDEYEEENDLIQQIVIASLWHYWREVTAISIVSAFVLNFFYSFAKRKLSKKLIKCQNEEISAKNDSESKPIGTPSQSSSTNPFDNYNGIENSAFSSRYESDFHPIQVLGRGGFGLVFEAKHIIDESHYAIKRIGLPFRKEQREKVMREVRALSKLEHSGIVRYYNAWVEIPPPGWQEIRDKQWDNEDFSKTQFNESILSDKRLVTDIMFDKNKRNDFFSETELECNSSKLLSTKTESTDSLDIVFDDNISSVKLVETNKCQTITESTTSGHKILESKESRLSLKISDRPTSLKTGSAIPRCYLYIQMQLCRKETLKDWLFANSLKGDSNIVLDIFDQIVSAVHYVHSMGLMHRDLKPTNIFFSMDGNIKIGDFGLVTATAVEDDMHSPTPNESDDQTIGAILNQSSSSHTNRVGTQLYMSPEQVKNLPYSHKVDIFSMGIILFELLIPFKTEMERNLLLINARKQLFPKDFTEKFIPECDLLKKLLAHNPDERPTTLEIKEHEVLRKLQTISGVVRQRSRTLSFTIDDRL